MKEKFGIGQPVSRFEDPRLLRGEGRFVNDLVLPGMAHLAFVRSPHPHARIASIDRAAAMAAPGVLGVYTVEDLERDGIGTTAPSLKRSRPGGLPMFWRAHPGLAKDKVRHVGDPVAIVVAATAAQAKDAAELLEVAYETLPLGDPVWDECPDNISNVHEVGNRTAAAAAFAAAAHVVKRRYTVSRVHAQFLEPRGAIGEWDAGAGRYTLHCDVQYPHRVREVVAGLLKVRENQVRVVSNDVGGAFGAKGWAHPEHRLVLWLARKLGRAVKWTCDRSEALLADDHARDLSAEIELAFDSGQRILALRARNISALGAYVSTDRNLLPSFANLGSLCGMYRIPAAHVQVTGVFSFTNSLAPYRGNGRPEAIYLLERLMDDAARELGVDRIELRRRNLIPPSAMPYRTAIAFTYDCGEFERGMDRALALADWPGFPARRKTSESNGRLRGIGLANAIERAAAPGMEYAEIRFEPTGTATLLVGTKSQGQGHETLYRQIACERLGISPGELRVIEGDTDAVAYGAGSFGSRSAAIGGTALWLAADKVIAKGRRIAAHLLEAAEADVAFAAGRFAISGTDRSMSLEDVARASFAFASLPKGMEPGLIERATFSPEQETFPNGTHVCEVEVDPQTGSVEFKSYLVVDDVGTEINPLTLHGQVVGGIVQGLGQVLMEQIVYDPETGQLLTGSFMDYAMPRAGDLCHFEVGHNTVPTRLNPLGAKGAGEAGTVGALAAAMNAIVDALGTEAIEMPTTPEKVWRALRKKST
ncbi:MAG: xanthine dehydrogenase family protein molybdopterin-binding subunit [Candidatus Parcubacteria bacterium]|nr:xanthine dehydrogenase family protein molybdopterin-binding subunit [Burkholderiales bacterium]